MPNKKEAMKTMTKIVTILNSDRSDVYIGEPCRNLLKNLGAETALHYLKPGATNNPNPRGPGGQFASPDGEK